MGKKNLSHCIAILMAYFLKAFVSLLLLDSALKKKKQQEKTAIKKHTPQPATSHLFIKILLSEGKKRNGRRQITFLVLQSTAA